MDSRQLNAEESRFISYAKAFGIIMVVVGHIGNDLKVFNPYFYHMPLFFVIGGILARPITDWSRFGKKMLTRDVLYIGLWYLILGCAALSLNNLLGTKIAIQFTDGSFAGLLTLPFTANMQTNSLFLTAWFLVAYAVSITLFKLSMNVMTYTGVDGKARFVLLAVGLVLGFLSIEYVAPLFRHTRRDWAANAACQIFVGYMYIAIGHFMRKQLALFKSISAFIVAAALTAFFNSSDYFHFLQMAWSRYPDGFFVHLVSSLVGCYMVLSLASLFSGAAPSRLLLLVGEYSRDIMTLHLFSIVLIDLLFAYILGVSMANVTAYAHYAYTEWQVLYVAGGVLISLGMALAITRLSAMTGRLTRARAASGSNA